MVDVATGGSTGAGVTTGAGAGVTTGADVTTAGGDGLGGGGDGEGNGAAPPPTPYAACVSNVGSTRGVVSSNAAPGMARCSRNVAPLPLP